ncbi:MAG: nicotinate-nucleotide--dimethylbenzimidazole phosphoribosyltransferase [Proteobacteria bacterium]|nr:nicotinate-nucleotide--dimethylbenzimidazole phosphoribosyltransferase [Pseudomonadota bacterium]
MHDLQDIIGRIEPIDEAMAGAAQRLLDAKTKPRRSLGRLEDLACQIAAIRGSTTGALGGKAIVVMAGDHGVAGRGVSAYPREVTRQMLLNFARGGAAINVLARSAGAEIVVVDMGVSEPVDRPESSLAFDIRQCRLGPGTADFCSGPAMTRELAERGLRTGIDLARELVDSGIGLLAIGDMGIANSTASSALTAVYTGAPAEEVTGFGTGIDPSTRRRKIEVIRTAIERNRPDPDDAIDVLAKLGGFEIAGLAGVVLGAATRRCPILVDGFIASAAALVAVRLAPASKGYLIASHKSAEPGHQIVLRAIASVPLFDLGLRLGEGTGAALAMNLVEASWAILREMATFAAAGVTDTGK